MESSYQPTDKPVDSHDEDRPDTRSSADTAAEAKGDTDNPSGVRLMVLTNDDDNSFCSIDEGGSC